MCLIALRQKSKAMGRKITTLKMQVGEQALPLQGDAATFQNLGYQYLSL